LRGSKYLLKKYKPKIIFECYGNQNFKQVSKYLENFGYSIKKISKVDYFADVGGNLSYD